MGPAYDCLPFSITNTARLVKLLLEIFLLRGHEGNHRTPKRYKPEMEFLNLFRGEPPFLFQIRARLLSLLCRTVHQAPAKVFHQVLQQGSLPCIPSLRDFHLRRVRHRHIEVIPLGEPAVELVHVVEAFLLHQDVHYAHWVVPVTLLAHLHIHRADYGLGRGRLLRL